MAQRGYVETSTNETLFKIRFIAKHVQSVKFMFHFCFLKELNLGGLKCAVEEEEEKNWQQMNQ